MQFEGSTNRSLDRTAHLKVIRIKGFDASQCCRIFAGMPGAIKEHQFSAFACLQDRHKKKGLVTAPS
jgi:hypothetical protein